MSINQNELIGYWRDYDTTFETFQFHRLHFNHDFVGEGKQ